MYNLYPIVVFCILMIFKGVSLQSTETIPLSTRQELTESVITLTTSNVTFNSTMQSSGNWSFNSSLGVADVTTTTFFINTTTVSTTTISPFVIDNEIKTLLSKLEPVFYEVVKIIYPIPTIGLLNELKSTEITNENMVKYINDRLLKGSYIPTINCFVSNNYYSFLERSFTVSNKRWLSDDIILRLARCRPDCNYRNLFQANYTNSTNATMNLVTRLMFFLPGPAGATCGQTLTGLLPPRPTTTNDILESLNQTNGNIGAFYRPSQLRGLSSDDTVKILRQAQNLDQGFIRVLGPKLPKNTSLGDAIRVLSAAPVEIILNSDANSLVANLPNMDLGNMDKSKKAVLVKKILEQPTSANLQNLITNGDKEIVNSVPLSSLKNLDVSTIPAANMPDSLVQNYARQQLTSANGLANLIDNQNTLKRIVGGLRPSDLKGVSNARKIDSAVNILRASSSGKSLSSTQRSSVYNMIIEGASSNANSSDPTVLLASLNQTHYEITAELFVQAPANHLSALAKINNNFGYILNSLSSISNEKCSSFPYPIKANFTSYAVQYLLRVGSKTSLSATDLVTLGQCFAATIPLDQFDKLTTSDFRNSISYFKGLNFQPNSAWSSKISEKIDALLSDSSNQNQASIDSLVNDLGETLMFYSKVNRTDNQLFKNSLKSSGNIISSAIKTSKNPNNDTIRGVRVGAGDDDNLKARYKAFKLAYAKTIFSSSRRKRQTASLTCDNLQNVSPDSFSAADLKTISASEFQSCLQTLGSSDNSYDTDQLTALLYVGINNGASSAYPNIASISDSDIQKFNVLLLGFTPSQLSQLKITSVNTIQTLGALNTWSAEQLTNLMKQIKASGLSSSDYFASLGNLACDLTDFTDAEFQTNFPTWKKLQNSVCPSLSTLYNRYKSINSISTLDSASVADMDGIAGGASISDINGMNPEVWLSFSSSAIKNMPATTVNQLPNTILSLTSSSQLSALNTSPYYSSFSDSVKASLTQLANGQTLSTTTSPSSDSQMIKLNLACLVSTILLSFVFIQF